MSSRNIESRLRALEATTPGEIILTLEDGSTYRHPGPPLVFYYEAMEEIRQRRRGPLGKAVARAVSAEGCGRLWELLKSMAGV